MDETKITLNQKEKVATSLEWDRLRQKYMNLYCKFLRWITKKTCQLCITALDKITVNNHVPHLFSLKESWDHQAFAFFQSFFFQWNKVRGMFYHNSYSNYAAILAQWNPPLSHLPSHPVQCTTKAQSDQSFSHEGTFHTATINKARFQVNTVLL